MNWIPLQTEEQLLHLRTLSETQPLIIFKHSTRCNISNAALNRLERDWGTAASGINAYYLDLLQYRELSRGIAQLFNVEHQSPQVLLIHHGKAIYHSSHFDIRYKELIGALETITS